ncbi:MAG: hypothetical protein LBT59_29085 [Clostridiales bacterium]|jgi:hypothetical protein|nr:hypothetical protein [Clostridiales bacterium]
MKPFEFLGTSLLSFLLSILLALTVVAAVIQTSIFSEAFFRKQVDLSGYSSYIMDELQDSLSSYGMVSSFDSAFFKSAVSSDALQADIYREVSRLYGHEGMAINQDLFRETLVAKLYEDVEKRGLEPTDNEREGIEYLADVSTEAYGTIVTIPFSRQISNLMLTAKSLMDKIFLGIIIADMAVLVNLLLFGSSHRKKFEGVANALAGALLMIGVPSVWVTTSGFYKNVALTSKALYYLVQSIVDEFFGLIWIYLAIMAVIWLLVFVSEIAYVQSKRKGHSY